MLNESNLFSSTLTLYHESSVPNATHQQGQSLSFNKGRIIEHVSETFPLLNLPDTVILCISDRLDYQSLRNFKISCEAVYKLITDNMLQIASIKDGLKKITPESIDTSLYSRYLKKSGDWETIGTFLNDGHEYSTECRELKHIYSYQSTCFFLETTQTLCFELTDGSASRFVGLSQTACDHEGNLSFNNRMSIEYFGSMKLAPSWGSLIDDLVFDELIDLVKGFHTNTPRILIRWLESSFQDEVTLREKLKTIFQHTSGALKRLHHFHKL